MRCWRACTSAGRRWRGEFDDYIARPKPNGYQSLHTVVRTDDERPVEIQIRTRAMHEHAEFGVAAHWAYKEAGIKGYAGVSAGGSEDERIAEARKAVLRQLLAWEREFVAEPAAGASAPADDRIYVFTPQAAVIELPAGATPIDFAYVLHTDLGHRCRGARVDGVLVPLNTPLANGQTVEINATKDGGPSLDWLNPELGYLAGARARAKVRAWFNAQAQAQTIAKGRELVEKLLQREGKTAVKHDELAARLGFKNAEALFEVVGKDEFSLRNIEQLLRPAPAAHRRGGAAAQALARGGGRRPRRRAGGRRRFAADQPGALLPAGAARCDRRLRHPRQGRGHPPPQLQQPAPHARARARARDRRRVGPRPEGGRPVPDRRAGRGRRPAGPAARHHRGLRQGEGERHRRATARASRAAAAPWPG